MAEFEIYEDQNNPGKFRGACVQITTGSSPTLVKETTRDKDDCEHGIELVKTQSPSATVQDLT